MLVYPLVAEVPTIKEVFEFVLPCVIVYIRLTSVILGRLFTPTLLNMNFKFIKS